MLLSRPIEDAAQREDAHQSPIGIRGEAYSRCYGFFTAAQEYGGPTENVAIHLHRWRYLRLP